MVKLESCMVAAVGSLNILLQFGWKNMQIQDHNQEDGERQNEIKRDITNKPHTLKTMAVKSQ